MCAAQLLRVLTDDVLTLEAPSTARLQQRTRGSAWGSSGWATWGNSCSFPSWNWFLSRQRTFKCPLEDQRLQVQYSPRFPAVRSGCDVPLLAVLQWSLCRWGSSVSMTTGDWQRGPTCCSSAACPLTSLPSAPTSAPDCPDAVSSTASSALCLPPGDTHASDAFDFQRTKLCSLAD